MTTAIDKMIADLDAERRAWHRSSIAHRLNEVRARIRKITAHTPWSNILEIGKLLGTAWERAAVASGVNGDKDTFAQAVALAARLEARLWAKMERVERS